MVPPTRGDLVAISLGGEDECSGFTLPVLATVVA